MVDLAAMVTSTLSNDRRSFQSVLMLANSVRKVKLVAEVLPPELQLTVLSSQNRVVESLTENAGPREDSANHQVEHSLCWHAPLCCTTGRPARQQQC